MLIFITIVHVVLAVFMIFVILLQPGKDAGMGAAFGGGAATSAFGGRGAVTFLSKVTAVCAGLFFLTSLGLSFVGMGTSVAAQLPVQEAPAAAGAQPTIEQPPADAPPVPPPAPTTEGQGSGNLQGAPLPAETPNMGENANPQPGTVDQGAAVPGAQGQPQPAPANP